MIVDTSSLGLRWQQLQIQCSIDVFSAKQSEIINKIHRSNSRKLKKKLKKKEKKTEARSVSEDGGDDGTVALH